jgi:hypothetical protein
MRFRFTIRDLLWLAVVVALAVGWWLHGRSLIKQRQTDVASNAALRRQLDDTNFQKVLLGLKSETISESMAEAALLRDFVPKSKLNLSEFTEYEFGASGSWGVVIVSKSERLLRAAEASCTGLTVYFDAMSPDENERYLTLVSEQFDKPTRVSD